ncbi:hypothetical protein DPMN_133908 [Dreissena polymorpha]|uniref:Uncharacterized protein n=1 Tax=Dreissena polymorpha TaxID=45954 RepID=A0A9D4FYU8_DREPO|nr:hypothetical protein DPMN_133908 [Dreissena polymorpha]
MSMYPHAQREPVEQTYEAAAKLLFMSVKMGAQIPLLSARLNFTGTQLFTHYRQSGGLGAVAPDTKEIYRITR